MVSALLLCVYAVLAGPVNFTIWRKRGKPLRALLYLPIIAAITILLVVIIGFIAKGCRGQARHLTMVEAGAGMKVGTARRWRGFFTPSANKLTVRSTNASSVLGVQRTSPSDDENDQLLVDRDGTRLVDLRLRPWQTVVVREDGQADLGEGIALVPLADPGETQIINRSGRKLRGLILVQPTVGVLYLAELDDGKSVSSTTFAPISARLTPKTTTGGLVVRRLLFYSL